MEENERNFALVEQLDLLAPGCLPKPVFEAVARLVVTPTFVVVRLFRRGRATRVVLTRRADDDLDYAGMLHPPGKVFLSTDNDMEGVFSRLVKTELQALDILSTPVFVSHFFDQITRGREISLVHYLEVRDPIENFQSYDPMNLPKDVIETDIPRIAAAAKVFNQSRIDRAIPRKNVRSVPRVRHQAVSRRTTGCELAPCGAG